MIREPTPVPATPMHIDQSWNFAALCACLSSVSANSIIHAAHSIALVQRDGTRISHTSSSQL